jgi:uncharacterized protein (DUF736 family)
MNQEREVRPNSGVLFSVAAKKTPKSPDYFGDIAVAASSIRVVDGVAVIKLSGWKKTSKGGKTYLSLSVDDRQMSAAQNAPSKQTGDNDEDPFK